MLNRATRIIADSLSTQSDILRLLPVSTDKVHVIYPGIDHAKFRKIAVTDAEAAVRSHLGIDKPYILAVGTLEPRKNLQTLVRAVMSIPETVAPLLLLTGALGWGDALSSQFFKSREVQARVRLAGYMPDELLPALYAAARAYVYPSWYEGFGFPILEAMACGTPVITSNVSSMPEVAANAALLCNPGSVEQFAQAITNVLTDEALRTSLTHSGLARARCFTWDTTARETIEVYQQAIDECDSRPQRDETG
jgi:glycosyltransferase involved in cell wall biosynthesis